MIARRLPPYARYLRDVLAAPATWPRYRGTSADGQHCTIWIAIGADAWAWARDREHRLLLVCPPGDNPARYDWSLLAGGQHDPILVMPCGPVDDAEIAALIGALTRDGVERVLYLADDGSRLYRAEERHAA